jgi:nucleotide-binding universal stress UspA family protein
MMFKHLLLPLDGSALAEAALPVAGYLADVLNAKITLIHVIEKNAAASIHGERHLTAHAEAEAYLEQIRERVVSVKNPVALHVHESAVENAAEGIVEHQDELAPDLIVMCSHGWGGVRDLLFGSIAQQVIMAGRVPVLLVRPTAANGRTFFECRSILSPTDGRPDHEKGLFIAARLAGALHSHLNLVAVAPTVETLAGRQAATGRFMPGATRTLLEMVEDRLRSYLEGMVERFQAEGVSASALVCRGDPADRIVRHAETTRADLIVFGTHGKAGTKAFWANSVGAQVLAKTSRPALLVPVKRMV